MPNQPPHSDLIQPYIDLWESVPIGRYRDNDDQDKDQVQDRDRDRDENRDRPPTPPPKPKEFQKLAMPTLRRKGPRLHRTETFGHQTPRGGGKAEGMVQVTGWKTTGLCVEPESAHPAEANAQSDSSQPATPQSVTHASIFAANNTYASVFGADPDASVLELAKPERREDATPSEKLPFTPDELWNFHRPRTPLPAMPTTVSWGPRRKSTVHKVDPVLAADFDFYGYPPFEHAPTSPRTNESEESVSPTSTTFSGSSGAYNSPASSVAPSPCIPSAGAPVSIKAAKMLGIDPSSRIIANRVSAPSSGFIAELPDRYNSHRTRSASAPHFPPVSLQKYNTVTRTPSAPTATKPPQQQPLLAASRTAIPYDATKDAKAIWDALYSDRKIDEDALSSTLVSLTRGSRAKLPRCKKAYQQLFGEAMSVDVRAETTLHYRTTLTRLIAGPHEAEAQALKQNESTFFMDDKMVAEALFGKTPEEIRGIKYHFEALHGIPLQKALQDLYLSNTEPSGSVFDTAGPSSSFGRACIRALRADRQVETLESLAGLSEERMMKREQRLTSDVENLYRADPQRRGSNKYLNQDLLLELVMRRSDLYLGELCRMFQERHGIQLAELALAKDRTRMNSASYYPVSLGYAVAHVLKGAMNKPQRDAKLLADAMKGLCTNDARLIARLIRIHYDPDPRHMLFVKEIYQQRYGKRLSEKVWKHSKGTYRVLLLKIVEGRSDLLNDDLF